jgi:hypothetical protein
LDYVVVPHFGLQSFCRLGIVVLPDSWRIWFGNDIEWLVMLELTWEVVSEGSKTGDVFKNRQVRRWQEVIKGDKGIECLKTALVLALQRLNFGKDRSLYSSR